MSFIWGNMLWLLSLAPLLVILYILAQRRRQKYALRYSSLSLVKEAVGRGPGFRRHIPPILFSIGLISMIVALARPAATVILPSQQATVILTFDVSGSMRGEDIKPNRIEAAKAAARVFVQKQPARVRIGIVSFSDSAAIVQGPTQDRESVLAAINRLTPQRRTAIGSGILTSLDAIFEEADAKPASSPRDAPIGAEQKQEPREVPPGSYGAAVIILLSDGVSNTGPPPLEVVDRASSRGVRVYTVGMGSAEGTVLRNQGYSIRVRLDEETLKRVAERTAASYFKAQTESDLGNIYESLSSRLVLKPQQLEVTVGFTALAAVLMLVAGTLSLLWFNRLP
ncbi:MAG: VWA domain-containing protein [Chloroflexi bacterium]|nr:VWA domain-containing protein [Chloroflexota bacterium]